jgi:hypothetical protein
MQSCKSRLHLSQRASLKDSGERLPGYLEASDSSGAASSSAPRIHRHSQSLAVTHDVPGIYVKSGKSKPPWIRPKGCGTVSAWFARQTSGVCDYWVDNTAVLSPSSAVAHSFPYEAAFRHGPPSTVTSPTDGCSRLCSIALECSTLSGVVALTAMVHFRAALQPCHSLFLCLGRPPVGRMPSAGPPHRLLG